jgi:hypothetical protein
LCGEPAAIDETTTEVPPLLFDPTTHRDVLSSMVVSQRIWTRNLGPTRFIYRRTLQDGKSTALQTGDYGQSGSAAAMERGAIIQVGTAGSIRARVDGENARKVELGPEGAVLARAATTEVSCPAIALDALSHPTLARLCGWSLTGQHP